MIDEDEPVIGSGYLDMPEFEEVKVLDEIIESDVRETEYIDKVPVPIESVPVEIAVESQIEVKSDVPMENNFTSIESTDFDLSEDVSYRNDSDLKAEVRAAMLETYVEFSILSVEEKVELFVIVDHADSLDVMILVMIIA